MAHHRFTPTRVGTTPRASAALISASVHPHACGDDGIVRASDGEVIRFTPTRVGTTSWHAARRSRRAVHPHACGDDDPGAEPTASINGSPPRVWGRLSISWAKYVK